MDRLRASLTTMTLKPCAMRVSNALAVDSSICAYTGHTLDLWPPRPRPIISKALVPATLSLVLLVVSSSLPGGRSLHIGGIRHYRRTLPLLSTLTKLSLNVVVSAIYDARTDLAFQKLLYLASECLQLVWKTLSAKKYRHHKIQRT